MPELFYTNDPAVMKAKLKELGASSRKEDEGSWIWASALEGTIFHYKLNQRLSTESEWFNPTHEQMIEIKTREDRPQFFLYKIPMLGWIPEEDDPSRKEQRSGNDRRQLDEALPEPPPSILEPAIEKPTEAASGANSRRFKDEHPEYQRGYRNGWGDREDAFFLDSVRILGVATPPDFAPPRLPIPGDTTPNALDADYEQRMLVE